MKQSTLQGLTFRGLVLFLAVALLPTPMVVAWFVARPSPAAATPEDDARRSSRESVTDLAPPQPFLGRDASEDPNARLTSLRMEPEARAARTQAEEKYKNQFKTAEEARSAQLFKYTLQLGNQARAEAAMAEIGRDVPTPPTLFSPKRRPAVPNPFVPLPAQADYRRGGRR
jgi:hypothetical protein